MFDPFLCCRNVPGGQAYEKELLGQLLIITMLHRTCSHLGTSELEAEKARVACVCLMETYFVQGCM